MPPLSVIWIRLSLLYLTAGSTLGAWLLAAKGGNGFPDSLRNVHREIMLAGWILQLVMGTAYWILPRVRGERGRVLEARIAFVLLNAGILSATAGHGLAQSTLVAAGHFLYAAGAVSFARHAWPRISSIPETER